ncbi:MAG: hypothetical protein WDO13_00590 [Verrucomicrobiota bacterium]
MGEELTVICGVEPEEELARPCLPDFLLVDHADLHRAAEQRHGGFVVEKQIEFGFIGPSGQVFGSKASARS